MGGQRQAEREAATEAEQRAVADLPPIRPMVGPEDFRPAAQPMGQSVTEEVAHASASYTGALAAEVARQVIVRRKDEVTVSLAEVLDSRHPSKQHIWNAVFGLVYDREGQKHIEKNPPLHPLILLHVRDGKPVSVVVDLIERVSASRLKESVEDVRTYVPDENGNIVVPPKHAITILRQFGVGISRFVNADGEPTARVVEPRHIRLYGERSLEVRGPVPRAPEEGVMQTTAEDVAKAV